MNSKTVYDYLENNPDSIKNRLVLIEFVKNKLQYLHDSNNYHQAVYDMAGMMSTKYVLSLPDDDELFNILILAGELEAPDDDADNKLTELIDLINKL